MIGVLEYLGIRIVDGIPVHCWSDGTEIRVVSGGADDTGDDDENENDDDTDETGDDDNDDAGSGEGVKDPEAKARSEEAKRYRIERNQERKRAEELAAKLKEYEDKDKSEAQKAIEAAESAQKRVEDLEVQNRTLAVTAAFYAEGSGRFIDLHAAVKLADLSVIEFDDEGQVTNMKDVVEATLKANPFLASKKADDEEGGDGGQQPSGRPMNGNKKKNGIDREALLKKFPALRTGR